mmetsp:Transcript_125894/g.352495  ORF Transcript_125894/g.352495 Transcript_125894/m.352495 type:complete len:335 (+) Transcript_125894:136-1140(+)
MAAKQGDGAGGEKESAALQKLRAAAGFVDRPTVERLDWMYEQSALSIQKDETKLMNTPIDAPKDKDIEDVKKLNESTPGSVFLKSSTKTTEDMLRKLREDPLFQIRRQEQVARENMMANPLVLAKLNKKAQKQAKKEEKKAKKEKKKAKKAAKKAKKALGGKKKKKKGSSSSSSSSDSTASNLAAAALAPPAKRIRGSLAPERGEAALGPGADILDKRAERAAEIAARRDAALASRGAPRKMSDEERQRRLEQMREDAQKHERHKDKRIAAAEEHEQQIEEKEKEMRAKSDQSYFREIRSKAYMGDEGATVADRLKNQRHRRAKNLNDPLERDG